MMSTWKSTSLAVLLIASVFGVLLPAGLAISTDHCHVFHRPWAGWLYHGLSGNARCQNAGLVNTYLTDPLEGFDSIFLGSSVSTNFIAARVAAVNGLSRTLKLTMPGALPAEQMLLAEYALATGRVERVFWELFPHMYLKYGDNDIERIGLRNEFPLYLYNRGRLDDYRYLFNFASVGAFLDILTNYSFNNLASIDLIGYSPTECDSSERCKPFHAAEDIAVLRVGWKQPGFTLLDPVLRAKIDYRLADAYLLTPLLPYCNSEVRFDVFLPPMSLLKVARESPDEFHYTLYMLRYAVERLAHCQNIRVHAFGDVEWIVGDLAHYRDPGHFYGGVQDYMIKSFASGSHVIRPDNVAAYEQRMVDLANGYVPWASGADSGMPVQ